MDETVSDLKRQLEAKDAEISRLKSMLSNQNEFPKVITQEESLSANTNVDVQEVWSGNKRLKNEEIARYSRQLILPEIGVKGQLSLSSKSALIVGAGGLGCPSAVYLAAAGIGRLGIIDYDEVEISNLHRQVLHAESRVGVSKAASVAESCRQLNSHVNLVPYHLQLDSRNALQIISQYDIVLDATDNVATRYLLNDACVIANKPLVSGSALRFEGQLTVYHHQGSPCYRCLYPKPPPPETVTNCSDGGVLGVIPGIIGCLQALEAIKIAASIESSYCQKMLLFDGLDGTFRKINLRGRQPKCPVCGDNPSITKLIDYVQFCGARADDKDKSLQVLSPTERITAKQYKSMLDNNLSHILLDIRTPVELDICKLPTDNSINIPISDIDKEQSISSLTDSIQKNSPSLDSSMQLVVVCRRGNDSQIAVQKLKEKLKQQNIDIKDISGGLTAWAKQVDSNFPVY